MRSIPFALAALLSLSGAASAQLANPVTAENIPFQVGRNALQTEMYLEPVLAWQERAARSISEGMKSEPSAELLLVSEGASMRLKGRDPMREYLSDFPESRIQRLLEFGPSNEMKSYTMLVARKCVADEVLRRPALAESHAHARFESVYMQYLLDADTEKAAEGFGAIEGNDEWSQRARSCTEALTAPESAAALTSSRQMLQDASLYEQRFTAGAVPRILLNQVRHAGGVRAWVTAGPPEDAGLRLKTVVRAAFELQERKVRTEVDEVLASSNALTPEDQAEIQYWIAHTYVADSMNEEASRRFAIVIESPANNRFPAYAAIGFMEAQIQLTNYLVGAEQALEIIERYPEQRDAVEKATKVFNFLVSSGLVLAEQAQAAHTERQSRVQARASQAANSNRLEEVAP